MGAFFGGRIIDLTSIKTTFLILSICSLIALILIFFYLESPNTSQHLDTSIREEFEKIKSIVSDEKIKNLIILVLLINIGPSMGSAIFYYLIDELKMTDS